MHTHALIFLIFILHTFSKTQAHQIISAAVDDDDQGWEGGGGDNTHDTAAYNGQEDHIYVPSTSTFNVHRCGSNPA